MGDTQAAAERVLDNLPAAVPFELEVRGKRDKRERDREGHPLSYWVLGNGVSIFTHIISFNPHKNLGRQQLNILI